MRFLAFVNWSLLAIGALLALLYGVVWLMMWPYPQLVEQAGGGFGYIGRLVRVLTGFTAVAGLSTWLLQRRHALWWAGQILLLAAFIFVALFVWTHRFGVA